MELFGKIADLCQALVVLLLVFQVSALFRSVGRLREKGEQLENRVDDLWRGPSRRRAAIAPSADSAPRSARSGRWCRARVCERVSSWRAW